MSILPMVLKEVEKFFPETLGSLQKNTSVQNIASSALLGVATFFTSYGCDKALRAYFLSEGTKGEILPLKEGLMHSLVEQTFYSVILRAPLDFFSSEALNRVMQISRFCVSFLLGANAARSLGFNSKAPAGQFSQDIICGFGFAVCREGSLLALPKSISTSLLMLTDGIVSSLVEACPKGGMSLATNEWYYKALSRGIFQITAGLSTIYSGNSISSFVQHALFNLTVRL